ncbi:hypothetical protein [Prauserella muralis]|uniref:Uncharacterized protein n=1 Tax=Prauserella muralis TaxID=588067 RepID=A0A2V4AKS0_9PSEU|nr:hypothetical protein [Prauserella muralis]PXY20877.1 hypothetical protein BAY60_25575 [Prauserella muralis]
MTTREVEWDDDEQAKVIAFLDYEDQLCPHCSGFLPDTTDPEKSWQADAPSRCYRCDVVLQKQADYTEQRRPEALVSWPVKEKD